MIVLLSGACRYEGMIVVMIILTDSWGKYKILDRGI